VEVELRRTVREIIVSPTGDILQDELERFLPPPIE
jgi:hypothetical protein